MRKVGVKERKRQAIERASEREREQEIDSEMKRGEESDREQWMANV